jgi:hypothetical protein
MDKPWLDEGVSTLATKVMGWVWDEQEGTWNDNGRYPVAGWNPFESIEDAFEVVAKLSADGLPLEMKEQSDRMTWEPVYIARFGSCPGAEAAISQPARVIARAALEAARTYYD